MPEIEVNIEVYCAECGEGLCNQTEATQTKIRGEPCFRVTPCQRCLDEAERTGYDKGYDEGKDEGYQNGLEENETTES